jgi:hypothetical protein
MRLLERIRFLRLQRVLRVFIVAALAERGMSPLIKMWAGLQNIRDSDRQGALVDHPVKTHYSDRIRLTADGISYPPRQEKTR